MKSADLDTRTSSYLVKQPRVCVKKPVNLLKEQELMEQAIESPRGECAPTPPIFERKIEAKCESEQKDEAGGRWLKKGKVVVCASLFGG